MGLTCKMADPIAESVSGHLLYRAMFKTVVFKHVQQRRSTRHTENYKHTSYMSISEGIFCN